MPEGFDKAADLKVVISAATAPLESGIKNAQGLVKNFAAEADSSLSRLDKGFGLVGGAAGMLASRMNIVVGAISTAKAAFSEIDKVATDVAKSVGASKEYEGFKWQAFQLQKSLLDLANLGMKQVQTEAMNTAAAFAGFEAKADSAAAKADSFGQKLLKAATGALSAFTQTLNEMAPVDLQTYDTQVKSLEKIDAQISEIERTMASGEQQAESYGQTFLKMLGNLDEAMRTGGAPPEETLAALKTQRDLLAEIIGQQAKRWDAKVKPADDDYLRGMEREVELLEKKAAALNLSAAAASTVLFRARGEQGYEGKDFGKTPAGEARLDSLAARHEAAQEALNAAEEKKRLDQKREATERTAKAVVDGMERELTLERARAATVGESTEATQALVEAERALAAIRAAGRSPTAEEVIQIRALAAERAKLAAATKSDTVANGAIAGLQRDLELQREQADALGMSAEKAAALAAEQRALNAIRDSGREPSADELIIIKALTQEKAKQAEASREQAEALATLEQHARIAGNALESAFSSWIKGTEFDWKSLVATMLEDMAQLTFKKGVVDPLVEGASSFLSDALGGLMGGGGSWDATVTPEPTFGGYRANGGPVEAGRRYIVGERGPEAFIPNVSGMIQPSGGRPITVVTQVDARGATTDAIAELKREMARRDAMLPGHVLSVFKDANERGML